MVNTTSNDKRNNLMLRFKRTWPLFVLLMPAVVYILVFCYYPIYGAQIAFRYYTVADGIINSRWIGLKNFSDFFHYYEFPTLLVNTLRISIYSIIVNSAVRLILALSINCMRREGLKKIIQTVTYMPHFISMVVMVGIVIRFLNPRLGIISKAIQFFGGTNRDLMGIPQMIPHLYVWSGVWQDAGWSTILYLATLSSVDAQLHEAALVDGANRFQRVLHIDIPTLVPTIVLCLIMDVGHVLSVGSQKMLLMQNDLNKTTSEIISTYVYSVGIQSASPRYSYASAISLFNNIVNFVMIMTVNGICKRLNQTTLW